MKNIKISKTSNIFVSLRPHRHETTVTIMLQREGPSARSCGELIMKIYAVFIDQAQAGPLGIERRLDFR